MKILITGAGGQLGSEANLWFTQRGHQVVALAREDLDITDPAAVRGCVGLHSPEWVINCAAYTKVDKAEAEPQEAFLLNSDGAGLLARSVTGCRFLHVSTDFVFGGDHAKPLTESDLPAPVNVYGESKLAGERAVFDGNPDALVLRTSWVFSSRGNNFLKTILRLAEERDELRVIDDQIGSPSATKDICGAMDALLSGGHRGLFHFSNEGVASWYDFAQAIVEEARNAGMPVRARHVLPIASSEYPAAARRPPYTVMSKRKVRSVMQAPIPHWRERVRAVIKEIAR